MDSKKGLQLSLNMIVVVIISLVFLGLAMSLLFGWFDFEMPTIPSQCDMYPPTAGDPVCIMSNIELSRGDEVALQVAFYNDEDEAIDSSQIPEIECNQNIDGENLGFGTTSQGHELGIAEYRDYEVILRIDETSPRGTFPCRITLSETSDSFSIKVD